MSRSPAYYHNISMKLTSVLEDIGVNENTVQMRRRLLLLSENLVNIIKSIIQDNSNWYFFGSQSEGTTTKGLNSDHDRLICDYDYIVLQDISEWKSGIINLLMFQDESTPPGYCMLEMTDRNLQLEPSVFREIITLKFTRQFAGKRMVKNSLKNLMKFGKMDENGPAFTDQIGTIEYVTVKPFKTLPNCLRNWLKQQLQKGRITHDMKRYIECHPCYAVPVGCKGSATKEIEWRISTSHAERCVMFNLNITQIQCYVMLKLMLKTHLKHPSEQGLSSFMCKNILLLCIDDTDSNDWCSPNLLSLFRFCLLQLEHCVSEEYCPHFIMHENNLMAGKFKPEVKLWLLDKIHELYQDTVSYFLTLTIDEVGRRIKTKLGISSHQNFHFMNPEDASDSIFYTELLKLAYLVNIAHRRLLYAVESRNTSFNTIIKTINHLHRQGDSLEHASILLLSPLIYSSLGSAMASSNIEQGQPVSSEALIWLSLGLNSDVTSGRLKLASVYYCTGEYSKAEAILRLTEDNYDTRIVQPMCSCNIEVGQKVFSIGLKKCKDVHDKDEQVIRHVLAYCVRFIRNEINCAPKELQYEMFRSTKKDLAKYNASSLLSEKIPENPKEVIPELSGYYHENKPIHNCWLEWVALDSLHFLYFLQYKIYGHLQRPADQRQALNKLACSINTTGTFAHTETSLNLLGQCLEQENYHNEAFFFYSLSVKICP